MQRSSATHPGTDRATGRIPAPIAAMSREIMHGPRRYLSHGPSARSARVTISVGFALLVLAGLFWTSATVRAQIAGLACSVPGVGIRACDTSGLVALQPASVSRNGITLTVLGLLSSHKETVVRLEFTGLPAITGPQDSASLVPRNRLQLAVREMNGRSYALLHRGPSSESTAAPRAYKEEVTFSALDPRARAVDVRVDGPPALGSWAVHVPVVPLQHAALPVASGGNSGITLRGVNVRVANVAADSNGATLQLSARTDAGTQPVGLGSDPMNRMLALQDDQGRVYVEQMWLPSDHWDKKSTVYTDDAFFAPFAGATRSLELTVPSVRVMEDVDKLTLRASVAGKQAGDEISLQGSYKLGPYPFQITSATLTNTAPTEMPPGSYAPGTRWLVLSLNLGSSKGGRKLIGLGPVESSTGDPHLAGQIVAGQQTELSVPLPPGSGDSVTLSVRNAEVEVEGPWRLRVPLAPGS